MKNWQFWIITGCLIVIIAFLSLTYSEIKSWRENIDLIRVNTVKNNQSLEKIYKEVEEIKIPVNMFYRKYY